MKKIFTFAAAILASVAMMAVEPNYESYDWESADAMAAGLAGDESVSISVVTGGSDGNVNGHWYKALNAAIDGSNATLGTHLSVSSASKIDSIGIFFCPNGTNNTSLAWAGWGEGVTPSAEVGTNYGATASVQSSKSWDNAVWQTIDLSELEIYTVYVSRQGKKLTNGGANISNFGDNQTVNLLGIRVWLAGGSTPSTDPVASVVIAGPDACFVGQAAEYTATTDVKATEYKWFVNDAEQEGATAKNFSYTPEAEGTFNIVCKAKNAYNDDFAVSNVIALAAANQPVLEQVDVTEATTWDWTKAASVNSIKWEGDQKDADPVLLANVIGMNNNADFNSQALLFSGEYPVRDGKYCQGPKLIFNTTVAGYIQVTFSNTGTKTDPRYVAVNDVVNTEVGTLNTTAVASAYIPVEAGEVRITGAFADGTQQYLRIYKVVFGTGDIPTAIENAEEAVKAVKFFENGQLMIEKNGVIYNAQGAIVK